MLSIIRDDAHEQYNPSFTLGSFGECQTIHHEQGKVLRKCLSLCSAAYAFASIDDESPGPATRIYYPDTAPMPRYSKESKSNSANKQIPPPAHMR